MSILTSWQKFFFEPPAPSVVFQLSPSFLACFRPGQTPAVSEGSYFQTSLPRGVIEANWLQPNIKQPEIIEELSDRAIRQLKPAGNSISLILPEMSARALIFSVENGSLSGTELTRFVEWRLEKALAQPLSDLRYSYQAFNSQGLKKVLAVCSGLAVIKDYEELSKSTDEEVERNFEIFWDEYPRKTDKKKAKHTFVKMKLTDMINKDATKKLVTKYFDGVFLVTTASCSQMIR